MQRSLRDDERLLAFLDVINIITTPPRVGVVVASLQRELFIHARIRLHRGKTQVWNGAGIRPPACDAFEQIARVENPRAVVWKGPHLVVEDQGIKVLGTPLGHPEFVTAHLEICMVDLASLCRTGELSVAIGAPVCRES